MLTNDLKQFSSCGGCTSKLNAELLQKVLKDIPSVINEKLIIGFESSDDAAVYKLTDDIALVQTLDFFAPMVDDPFLFGKIAAANALSDVYAMGGDVLTAMNIVCFPEKMNADVLGEILRGGAEKVKEAGGVLCGGHSVADKSPKYGLSVTGVVNPKKVFANNSCEIGDKIILTKPLGVGIVMAANVVSLASDESYETAVTQMQFLNKYASEIMRKFDVKAVTDVTGFGFLGHLSEMCTKKHSIIAHKSCVPYIPQVYNYASNFLTTAAGQRNRNFFGKNVKLVGVDEPLTEILFDPQTSGGLLISVSEADCAKLLDELNTLPIKSAIVGEVVSNADVKIIVR